MKIPCFIRDGELSFPGHSREMIKQNKDGTYVMDLVKEKSKATGSMFSYLYGYVYPEILKAMGEFRSKENVDKLDETLKDKFGISEVRTKYVLMRKAVKLDKLPETTEEADKLHSSGQPFVKVVDETVAKEKARYTVDEMQEYFIALQSFASQFFELVINDPDPNWREHWKPDIEK